MLLALAGAGCSGDDDASADASSTTTAAPAATTTTQAPATTTTTVPPPYSFDGSVPPPPLEITGDDFDAIYRSLDTYANWQYAHNPDTNLVGEVAAPGSPQFATLTDDLAQLSESNLRFFDEGSIVESVEVADTGDDIVTLVVVYAAGRGVAVDSSGTVLDDDSHGPIRQISLLSVDAAGRWKYNSNTISNDDPVEVGE